MAERRERVIVLGGGVGPMAGVAAHARLIAETAAPDDQSHPAVHHFSRSAGIPDRTRYLLALAAGTAGEADNPALAMAEVFDLAARSLADGEEAVGGVPCNTFHAPAIFERFLAELAGRGNPVRVINMLEETLGLLRDGLGFGPGARIGVLSTTGTRMSGVYDNLLATAGFRPLRVAESDQPLLHDSIYHPGWGIKAGSPPSWRAVETAEAMAGRLADTGAEAIVLACTELPLALPGESFRGLPLVDPVRALARGLIREAAPDKLKPLR